MKRIIYSLMTAAVVFCVGCGQKERGAAPSSTETLQPTVPTEGQYRALLEKRAASVDGANINIKQEVSKYANASDAEKRELYNKVKALVK